MRNGQGAKFGRKVASALLLVCTQRNAEKTISRVKVFLLYFGTRVVFPIWCSTRIFLRGEKTELLYFLSIRKVNRFFFLFTWVTLQYSPQMTLANGSDSPEASDPMRERAWYMCALSWKNCQRET